MQADFLQRCQPCMDLYFQISCLEAAPLCSDSGKLKPGSKSGFSYATFSISVVPSGAFLCDCRSLTTLPCVRFGQQAVSGSSAQAVGASCKCCMSWSAAASARGPALSSQLLVANRSEILNPLVRGYISVVCTSCHGRYLNPLCTYRAYPQHGSPARTDGFRWF